MAEKQKDGFIMQAGILALAGILVRIIGILYRSPLVGIIGDEGNGYYNTAYTIYTIILLISSYSIPSAISKVIADRLAKKEYRNAHKIFMGSFYYVIVVGGVASAVCFFGANYLVGESSAKVLRVFAPTIFLSGLLGVLRGYFQAHRSMVQTSFSQIIEQIMNAGVSIGAAYFLMRLVADRDPSTQAVYGAAGSALGTGMGVAIALLFMVFAYSVNRKMFQRRREKDRHSETLSYGQVFGLIFAMVTPVILSTCIYNMSNALNLKIYCAIVENRYQYTEAQATLYYGLFSGKASQITNIPIALATAMSAAIIPTVAGTFGRGELESTREKIGEAIKTTMLISIPAAFGILALAKPVVFVLYPQRATVDLVSHILMVLAVTVVFYGLSTLSNAILQGTGYVNRPVIHASIALVMEALVLVLLLQYTSWNLFALAIATIVYSFLMCILNGFTMRQKLQYRQEYWTTFLLPTIAGTIMAAVAFGVYHGLYWVLFSQAVELTWTHNVICLIPSIIVAVLIYFVLVIKFGAITERELRNLPKGSTLVKIAKKMRLLKKK
ncbi:MAG: polysaccharide biosynthesis protein [Lachnospiraceae bacterium]|nr:polysaccharide biosynthesis protein [Lachnospiraceae bacterium]